MFKCQRRGLGRLAGLAAVCGLTFQPQAEGGIPTGAVVSRAVTQDGAQFTAWVSSGAFAVPAAGAGQAPDFVVGVEIKNVSRKPFCLSAWYDYGLSPQLVGPDGQAVPLLQPAIDMPIASPKATDYPIVPPGGSFEYAAEARFTWHDGRLAITDAATFTPAQPDHAETLAGDPLPGGGWAFDGLPYGTYHLRLRYSGRNAPRQVYDPNQHRSQALDAVWNGVVTMPPITFRLEAVH